MYVTAGDFNIDIADTINYHIVVKDFKTFDVNKIKMTYAVKRTNQG